MKFGTTQTSPIDSGSNRNNASRKLGSSFQNAHSTSAKIFRRRISAACASVGALESGFTVEPCPTIKRALCSLEFMRPQKTSNVCATFARLRGGKLFATIQLLERGVLCTREPPFPIRKSLPLRRERGRPRLHRGYGAEKTNRLSWGKRGDDFFEAGIAAQRVPKRQQF